MIERTKEKIFVVSQKWGKRLGLDLPYFLSSGFWMTLRQGTEIIAGFLLLMVFVRYTSKEVFGQYQLIISIFNIVSILSLPGINTAVLRSIARGNDGDYNLGVRTSFFWSLLGIPALLAVGAYYFFFIGHAIGTALMISSIFFPFFYAPNTWPFLLQGKKLYKTLFGFNSVRAVLNAIVTALVIFASKGNLFPIIMAYFLSYSFFSVFYYIRSQKYIENNRKDPDMEKYGKFITKISAFNLFAENADKIIISFMLSVSDIAIFSVVSMVAVKLRGFVNPIFSIVFPKMSADTFDFGEMWKKNKKVFLILFLLSLVPGAIFYLIAVEANLLFFGSGYGDYFQYSKIFSIFVMFFLPIYMVETYIIAKKMTRALLFARPAYFFVKIALSVTLIHFFGLLGVIWAYNISVVALFFLYLILSRMKKPSPAVS